MAWATKRSAKSFLSARARSRFTCTLSTKSYSSVAGSRSVCMPETKGWSKRIRKNTDCRKDAKHVLSEAEGHTKHKQSSKLEIRNSKQFQMVKNQKVPNQPFRNS